MPDPTTRLVVEPSYRSSADPAEAAELVKSTKARAASSAAAYHHLLATRGEAVEAVRTAEGVVGAAGVVLAHTQGTKAEASFAERSDKLMAARARLAAIDDHVIPAAKKDMDDDAEDLRAAQLELVRARVCAAVAEELIPADRLVFHLFAELDKAIEAAEAVRQAISSQPRAAEFTRSEFGVNHLELHLLTRCVTGRVYRLVSGMSINASRLADPAPFHAERFGLTTAAKP